MCASYAMAATKKGAKSALLRWPGEITEGRWMIERWLVDWALSPSLSLSLSISPFLCFFVFCFVFCFSLAFHSSLFHVAHITHHAHVPQRASGVRAPIVWAMRLKDSRSQAEVHGCDAWQSLSSSRCRKRGRGSV